MVIFHCYVSSPEGTHKWDKQSCITASFLERCGDVSGIWWHLPTMTIWRAVVYISNVNQQPAVGDPFRPLNSDRVDSDRWCSSPETDETGMCSLPSGYIWLNDDNSTTRKKLIWRVPFVHIVVGNIVVGAVEFTLLYSAMKNGWSDPMKAGLQAGQKWDSPMNRWCSGSS